ncbi:MAG: glycosyltransferase [Phycisphaerae bacterium]
MPSLIEIVERVSRGDWVDAEKLEVYLESNNAAEKFLAHHARAMLDLRQCHRHMLTAMEAMDYADQKVLSQFIAVSGFLGLDEHRTAPMVKFGASAIGRREISLGLEAIQNGIALDLAAGGDFINSAADAEQVAMEYDRAAGMIDFRPAAQSWNHKIPRVAYLASAIADDEPTARTVIGWARHIDPKKVKLTVYSTEAGVRRDKQQFPQASYVSSSRRRGSGTLEQLSAAKIDSWLAPTDVETTAAAKQLAEKLIEDQADIVIFDTTPADAIAAMLAAWPVAAAKVNLCRRTPMLNRGIQQVWFTDRQVQETHRYNLESRDVATHFVYEGIDASDIPAESARRGQYGIPDQAAVLATSGEDLDAGISEAMVEAIITVLRDNPQAVWLLVGPGELSWQKRRFEAAGVAKRIGFVGKRRDATSFLRMADVYVAESPRPTATGVLQAMAIEKPVAILAGEGRLHQAGEFVGEENLIAGTRPMDLVRQINDLIRDRAFAATLGKTMGNRAGKLFGVCHTARKVEGLCGEMFKPADVADIEGEDEVRKAA